MERITRPPVRSGNHYPRSWVNRKPSRQIKTHFHVGTGSGNFKRFRINPPPLALVKRYRRHTGIAPHPDRLSRRQMRPGLAQKLTANPASLPLLINRHPPDLPRRLTFVFPRHQTDTAHDAFPGQGRQMNGARSSIPFQPGCLKRQTRSEDPMPQGKDLLNRGTLNPNHLHRLLIYRDGPLLARSDSGRWLSRYSHTHHGYVNVMFMRRSHRRWLSDFAR